MTGRPPLHLATLVVLLVLTAATAGLSNGRPAWPGSAVLAIAFAKMMLVAFRFMNLRHAHPFWKGTVILVIAAFASILGLLIFR